MPANINLDTVLNPLAYLTNFGVNQLTNLYAHINPKGSEPVFHYDTKVVIFNVATAFMTFQVAKTALGRGSIRATVIDVGLMLLIRSIIDRSMSPVSGGMKAAQGLFHKVTGKESFEDIFASSNLTATMSITGAKALATFKNTAWKENLLEIQGYPVLKNWV